jgi:hypothetical protein
MASLELNLLLKKSGMLANFAIKKGLTKSMDFSAIECLQGMPKWNPAKKQTKNKPCP